MVQGRKGGGLTVIVDAASLCRVSLRAADSKRAKDFSFTPLQTKLSTHEGNSRMKLKGTARKKIEQREMFLQNKPFW